jgi:hypothetical protein
MALGNAVEQHWFSRRALIMSLGRLGQAGGSGNGKVTA